MTDASKATENSNKPKRFRSPAYPAIPLQKAIYRAEEMHKKTLHHATPASVLADAWGYGIKSSGLFATIAALKQFGLLADEGSGGKRRFRLTERAIRIVRDPDPQSSKRRAVIRQAALTPKIHLELWEKYNVAGASGSMDLALNSYLTVDRADGGEGSYGKNAAEELVEEYKSTLAFAGITVNADSNETVSDTGDSDNLDGALLGDEKFGGAKVGDLIQWESGGILQFPGPKRVRMVSDDGDWVVVEGSETGIKMAEVIVKQRGTEEAPPHFPMGASPNSQLIQGEVEWLRIKLGPKTSIRLLADGEVGDKELGRLIKMLVTQRSVLADDATDDDDNFLPDDGE
ncbi:MAG: hypothetical protein HOB82_04415 [Alphaproteobacteria bacterium]|jgi:hypothetical protein|nr:hypothetical protein [Alphaproteobacteria bacterium]